MKKSFSGLGTRMAQMLGAAAAILGINRPRSKSFNAPEANPIKRSGKSSGGSSKNISKSPETHAWKRAFGGLAVPPPGFLDLDTPPLKFHKANIRGPRPYSFYKLSRA